MEKKKLIRLDGKLLTVDGKVVVIPPPPLPNIGIGLEECSWKDISRISEAGLASTYFSVGDTKTIKVSGTVGTVDIDDTYCVYILGFDHNGAKNAIDFGTFKTIDGTDICLIDSNYGSSSTSGAKYFNMNHSSDTNSGGWKGCDLRYDILGSTDAKGRDASATTATDPVAGTLMAALPADLRAVMRPMTIYTDNTGGGSNTVSYVTTSVDYLPLLAEFEIAGKKTYANKGEQSRQTQYDYYKTGNSNVKRCHSDIGSTARWHGRSVYYGNSTHFHFVNTGGDTNATGASYSIGLAPIFRV